MPSSEAQLAAHHRAVDEFVRLQSLRAKSPNEPILEVQTEENENTYIPQRRTHFASQSSPGLYSALPRLEARATKGGSVTESSHA